MINFISDTKELSSSKISQSTIDKCLEYFNDISEIQLDTETIGEEILMLQLGTYTDQFVLDWENVDRSKIKDLLEDTTKVFILQNANFDLKKLYRYNIDVQTIYDTFIAECILTTGYIDTERDLSLTGLGHKYLNLEISKERRGTINYRGIDESTIDYAATDVKYLSEIKRLQLKAIQEYQLEDILEIEIELIRVLAKMEYRGIKFDIRAWTEVTNAAIEQLSGIEEDLDKLVYDVGTYSLPEVNDLTKYVNYYVTGNLFFEEKHRKSIINWKSSKQKLEVLKILGLEIDSTAEDTLKENMNKHEVVPKLISYSKTSKMVTSFGEEYLKFVNPETGRIHSNHWQILSTGRLSMSKPNIQQVPAHGELASKVRKAFVATSGYKMVCADYSSIELAIIAEFSQDPVWLEILNRGGNLHSELCALTFDIPLSDVTKPFPYKPEFSYRDVQKTIDFGLAYGMSEFKLSSTIGVDVKEAKQIINKFFSKIPKVRKFLELTGSLAVRRGYIATPRPLRRIRWFGSWKTEYGLQEANKAARLGLQRDDFRTMESIRRRGKNTPIQGTNANIIKLALGNLLLEIEEKQWPAHLLLTVHDEIISEVIEDRAEEWKVKQQEIMIQAAKTVIKTVPIKADPTISDYWTK